MEENINFDLTLRDEAKKTKKTFASPLFLSRQVHRVFSFLQRDKVIVPLDRQALQPREVQPP
jgi:hypothetical protein